MTSEVILYLVKKAKFPVGILANREICILLNVPLSVETIRKREIEKKIIREKIMREVKEEGGYREKRVKELKRMGEKNKEKKGEGNKEKGGGK